MTLNRFAVIAFVALLAAGCGGSETTTTTVPTTTSTAVAPSAAPTTTTTVDTGPQPFLSGSLLEPGEYVTTVFAPTTVGYRVERKHLLRAFQSSRVTGFESVTNDASAFDYRGVAVHGFWHDLTPEEVLQQLKEIEQLKLAQATETEVGGFPGHRFKASVTNRTSLWITLSLTGSDLIRDWPVQKGPLDIIIIETPAGTLFVTIASPQEQWDEFLPVAEEILAGISFPDLESP